MEYCFKNKFKDNIFEQFLIENTNELVNAQVNVGKKRNGGNHITDLLIGVVIGIAFAVYYLIVHTYRAGYTIREYEVEGKKHFFIELALNVSFLNKKRISEMLDKLPEDSAVEIIGSRSVYIDHDILEIFQDFKAKAKEKDIHLVMKDIPEVETMELH